MKIKAGDDIYCFASLYYACKEDPYNETGDTGQGILKDKEWYKVLEVNDDKGAFIQGPRESMWLNWLLINDYFGRYFYTLEEMEHRKRAAQWLKETQDIEGLRELAQMVRHDDVVAVFNKRVLMK
jgi:hypothetical protein